jgi:hypothetical protein
MQQFLSTLNLSEGMEKTFKGIDRLSPNGLKEEAMQQLAAACRRQFLALGRIAIFAYLWRKSLAGGYKDLFRLRSVRRY